MPIIKSTYPEGHILPSSKIVVCDLHFDSNTITNLGSRKRLAVDAIPDVRYNFDLHAINETTMKLFNCFCYKRLCVHVKERTEQANQADEATGATGATGATVVNGATRANSQQENDLEWLNSGLFDCFNHNNDQDDGHQVDVLEILGIFDANNK